MEGYARFRKRTRTKELLRKGFLRFLGWFFRHIMTLEVRGLENVPNEGAYIIAANHNGHGDHGAIVFALGESRSANLKVVGARDHFFEGKRAILGIFWDAAIGAVPLERREGRGLQAKKDFAFLEDLLAEGRPMLIYPEGGRKSRDDGWNLHEFKRGVGLLARGGHAPVIPCAIKGTEQFLTRTRGVTDFLRILLQSSRLENKKVIVYFGEPIPLTTRGKKAAEIAMEAQKEVQRLLDRIKT